MNFTQLSVGERLKLARKAKKFTQEYLGEQINVSKNQIYNIEKGTSAITKGNCIVLCGILGISEEWLYTGKGEFNPNPLDKTNTLSNSNISGGSRASNQIGNNSGLNEDERLELAQLRIEIEYLKRERDLYKGFYDKSQK